MGAPKCASRMTPDRATERRFVEYLRRHFAAPSLACPAAIGDASRTCKPSLSVVVVAGCQLAVTGRLPLAADGANC